MDCCRFRSQREENFAVVQNLCFQHRAYHRRVVLFHVYPVEIYTNVKFASFVMAEARYLHFASNSDYPVYFQVTPAAVHASSAKPSLSCALRTPFWDFY